MATRIPYFESAIEADSYQSTSPDLIDELFPLGLDDHFQLDTLDPTWDSLDLGSLTVPWEYHRPSTISVAVTSSDDGAIPKSKMVRYDLGGGQEFITILARRRAQNRASQRAFRERKDRHVKGLQYQLETLNEKHQDLLQSYTKQAEDVTRLHGRVAQLQAEIEGVTLRDQQDPDHHKANTNTQTLLPESFDAFSLAEGTDLMLYDADEPGFDDPAPVHNSSELAIAVTPLLSEDVSHIP